MRPYKYNDALSALQCDLNIREVETPAYRWTFEDLTMESNFLPRALIFDNPQREKVSLECGGWSLSMFDSIESARSQMLKINKYKSNLHKKIGTHISRVEITPTHGKCTDVNTAGHFDLFEYENTILEFTILEPIYND